MLYNKDYKMLLGTSVAQDVESVVVKSDDDEVEDLIGTPWFNAFIKDRYGIDINPRIKQQADAQVILHAGILSEHAVLFGAPGGGKTTLAPKIIHDQLKAGASAVVFDSKERTIQESIEVGRRAGLRPEQITILYPDEKSRAVPGWNPLTCTPDRLKENASEFLDLILNGEEPGVTIGPPIRFAAMLLSALHLSVQEMVWFFRDARYREGLLGYAQRSPHRHLLYEVFEYFSGEFKSRTRDQPSDPVLNKILKFTDNNDYLKALFTAEHNTLDLPSLWLNQRLVLVHLNMPEPENRLLAQMIARSLYRTSLRNRRWERPVIMLLDEIARLQDAIKDLVIRTQAIGRNQGLWVLGATQDPNLISSDLKQSLTGNLVALKAYFRMDKREAPHVAEEVMDLESGSRAVRIIIDVAKRDRLTGTEQTRSDASLFYTGSNTPSTLSMQREILDDINAQYSSDRRLERLRHYLGLANIPFYSVEIHQDNQEFYLDDYVALAGEAWELVRPQEVSIRVTFPKPKIIERITESEAERIQKAAKILQQPPKQHAFLWSKEQRYGQVHLVHFDLSAATGIVIERHLQGHQSNAMMTATVQKRENTRRMVLNSLPPPESKQTPERSRLTSTSQPQKPQISAPPTAQRLLVSPPQHEVVELPKQQATAEKPKSPPRPKAKPKQVKPMVTKKLEPEVYDDGSV